MRIVAGRHKRRQLAAPEGLAVRPTADRTREALFDILTQGRIAEKIGSLKGPPVLDAFAGTGALGLEALSRGAGHATFLENQAAALAALERNIGALGEQERSTVLPVDVLRPPPPRNAPCSIVLMDPPYNQGLAAPALEALDEADWLAPAALIAIELMKAEPFAPPAGFELLDERTYGKAKLVFLCKL